MNLEIAKRGIELEFGQVNERLRENGDLSHSLISDIEFCTSCASFARMSGNQGILLFLPLYIIAKRKNIDEERMLRSIAFAQVFNLYAKHFIGILSPICSCGVASGVAVSAATVYLLNGTIDQIEGAIKTMLSCITGMICDGAKESCAHIVSLSSGFAVKSALQSMEGSAIKDGGIITSDIADLYERVSTLSKEGMKSANKTMIDIMFRNITTWVGTMLSE